MLMPKDGAAVQMFDERGRVPATLIVVPVEADPYQLWAHVKYLQGSSEPQDMSGVNLGKLEGF